MLSPTYRLLLGRLQELLPTWTIRESADGEGIHGRGQAGEILTYGPLRRGDRSGWLRLSRGPGQVWVIQGPYSPGEVTSAVADALGLALSIRGDFDSEEVSHESP